MADTKAVGATSPVSTQDFIGGGESPSQPVDFSSQTCPVDLQSYHKQLTRLLGTTLLEATIVSKPTSDSKRLIYTERIESAFYTSQDLFHTLLPNFSSQAFRYFSQAFNELRSGLKLDAPLYAINVQDISLHSNNASWLTIDPSGKVTRRCAGSTCVSSIWSYAYEWINPKNVYETASFILRCPPGTI